MSEYADKYSKNSRNARVEHIINSTSKGKVDASGYEVPGELHTEEKTGPCKPKPRAYAKGGKVEGDKAHHHAGRKSRDAGGNTTAAQKLVPSVPTGGIYGSGFTPTHSGMLAQGAGFKKGGEAKKRAKGGEVPGNSEVTGTRPKGGRMARADGGRAKGKTNINIIIGAPKDNDQPPMVPPPPSAVPPGGPPRPPGLPPAAMGAMQPPGMGGPSGPGMPPPMPPAAMPRARGGRTYPLDAASGGGEGRLEKIAAYGEK